MSMSIVSLFLPHCDLFESVNYKCIFSYDRTIKKLQVIGYFIIFPNEQKRVF